MTVDEVAASRTAAVVVGSTWEAGRSAGKLVVAWQHPESRLIAPVGLLEHGDRYRFRYLRRAAEIPGFQRFLSFPQWERAYTSDTLFPLFAQRIMSPRRPDYSQFLRQLDLDASATPWEQLARSEGRSSGDTVQVFPVPMIYEDGSTVCRFLVHGVSHVNRGHLPPLSPGDALVLRDAPDNPVNQAAVLVCAEGGRELGYVPDLLLEYLDAVRGGGVSVTLTVAHVNGPDTPSHLRLLVCLEGRTRPGYQPMSGPGWEPFVD